MLEEMMEEVNETMLLSLNKKDAKVKARRMASGMLRNIGFFGLNNFQKHHIGDVVHQMLIDLVASVDMSFNGNFRLFFLRKFLEYTKNEIQLNLLNEEANRDFVMHGNNGSGSGG